MFFFFLINKSLLEFGLLKKILTILKSREKGKIKTQIDKISPYNLGNGFYPLIGLTLDYIFHPYKQ